MLVSVYCVLVKCKHMLPWLVWYWDSSEMSGPGSVRVSSGKVKSSWQINFVLNEIYSQVAAEVIETWHHASLKMSNSDAVSKNIRNWHEQGVKFSHMFDAVRLRNKRFTCMAYEPDRHNLLDICTCKCKALHLPVRMAATSFITGKAANKLWSCSFKL